MTSADLRHRALVQRQRLCVQNLQDDVAGVTERLLLPRDVRQERIGCEVQRGEAPVAETVALGADGSQHQDDIMVRRVHAVEVCEVEARPGLQQVRGGDLEAQRAVRRVVRREARVELGVAAQEDAAELPVDGRAVAAAVVFQRRRHRTATFRSLEKTKINK